MSKILNSTVSALLAIDLKTDRETINKQLVIGGQSTAEFLGHFVNPEHVRGFNQKRVLTVVKLANFVTSGATAGYMRESAILAAIIALLPVGSRVDFESTRFAMGGKGSEHVTPLPGVSRARMVRFFGLGNMGTISTRLSQIAVMWENLGVLSRDAHGFTVVNRSVPLLVAYAHALEKMTDSQLALLDKTFADK
jgi:hypothetical protein